MRAIAHVQFSTAARASEARRPAARASEARRSAARATDPPVSCVSRQRGGDRFATLMRRCAYGALSSAARSWVISRTTKHQVKHRRVAERTMQRLCVLACSLAASALGFAAPKRNALLQPRSQALQPRAGAADVADIAFNAFEWTANLGAPVPHPRGNLQTRRRSSAGRRGRPFSRNIHAAAAARRRPARNIRSANSSAPPRRAPTRIVRRRRRAQAALVAGAVMATSSELRDERALVTRKSDRAWVRQAKKAIKVLLVGSFAWEVPTVASKSSSRRDEARCLFLRR